MVDNIAGKRKIKKLVKDIEGFLTDKDGALLFDLAKRVSGRGVILEIGSWKGKSTIWLAKGSKEGNKIDVYAVDHHVGSQEHKQSSGDVWTFDEFKANMDKTGVTDIVKPIVKTSEDASIAFQEPIELLFIDGAHDFDSVKSDYDAWSSKVIDGGTIAFHDSEFSGVTDFLEELVNTAKKVKLFGFGGSIACVRKVGEISKLRMMRNRQLVKVIRFRGEIDWAKKKANWAHKPLYNLIRNMSKVYRFILLKIP